MHWLRRFATLSVLLAATAALPKTDAAYCTSEQAEAIESEQLLGRGNAYSSACSMISANKFKLDAVSWMNETELAGVAGCKAPVCLDALRTMVPNLPDCEYYVFDPKNAFNLKTGYATVLTMCEKFAKGPVTKAELVALFKPVEKYDGSRDAVAMGDVTTAPPTTVPPPTTPRSAPAPTPTSANECPQKTLDKIEADQGADYTTACKSTVLSVIGYTVDYVYLSDSSLQSVCKEDKCIDAVRKLVTAYPQCIVQGVDIYQASRASYEGFERACARTGKQIVPLQGVASAAGPSRLSGSRGAVVAWTLLLSVVAVGLY